MKRTLYIAIAALMVAPSTAFAQNDKKEAVKDHLENHFKVYGFVRNYFAFDTRESTAGTGDLYYYMPKDENWNFPSEEAAKLAGGERQDLNAIPSFRYLSLTSRVGMDITGYEIKGYKIGGKIEADFYAGISGATGTAQLRLRQAYATVAKDWRKWTLGQAWHPMAADMPDIFSLNTGAPFGPFGRTPLAQFDRSLSDSWSLTAAAIWQQQYTSAGPEGASANYMKYGGIPEIYAGVSYNGSNGLIRLGVDMLSIKPYQNKSERLTTVTPFLYAQYAKDLFSVKFKTVYAQAGEQVCLNGGYGLAADGGFTPTTNSSSWISLAYGKDWKWILFGGYVKNFGTTEALANAKDFWFSKNSFSNMNAMYRLTPTVIRSFGKVQLGLEYELTSVLYGDSAKGINLNTGLFEEGLHWVTNNRVQMMLKYTF